MLQINEIIRFEEWKCENSYQFRRNQWFVLFELQVSSRRTFINPKWKQLVNSLSVNLSLYRFLFNVSTFISLWTTASSLKLKGEKNIWFQLQIFVLVSFAQNYKIQFDQYIQDGCKNVQTTIECGFGICLPILCIQIQCLLFEWTKSTSTFKLETFRLCEHECDIIKNTFAIMIIGIERK